MSEIYLTKEGKKEKEKRLDYLKNEGRADVVAKLKSAREFGDLSENAEYDAARDEQRMVESEINLLEETLRVAKIVDVKKVGNDFVSVGTKVKLYDKEYDEEIVYSIVGSLESNPSKGLISNVSPLGQSLMGKKVGEIINVETPGGQIEMKILSINS